MEIKRGYAHDLSVLDYLLHAATNRSLNLTIQHTIGPNWFHWALKEYGKLKSTVDSACRDKVNMPCSKKGGPQPLSVQSCYNRDFGCGYPCANKVLENLTKKGWRHKILLAGPTKRRDTLYNLWNNRDSTKNTHTHTPNQATKQDKTTMTTRVLSCW